MTAPLRILIACEMSGLVRDAFRARGQDAVSCDLLPSLRPGPHMQRNALEVLHDSWDMMIAFPPCTHLAASGARWWGAKQALQEEALAFVQALLAAPIPHIALENPVGIISTRIRKSDQIIQPYLFGDEATKTTCLWLKNLPFLQPTKIVAKRPQACWRMSPSEHRSLQRSLTYPGIAAAMASQWSRLIEKRGNE